MTFKSFSTNLNNSVLICNYVDISPFWMTVLDTGCLAAIGRGKTYGGGLPMLYFFCRMDTHPRDLEFQLCWLPANTLFSTPCTFDSAETAQSPATMYLCHFVKVISLDNTEGNGSALFSWIIPIKTTSIWYVADQWLVTCVVVVG